MQKKRYCQKLSVGDGRILVGMIGYFFHFFIITSIYIIFGEGDGPPLCIDGDNASVAQRGAVCVLSQVALVRPAKGTFGIKNPALGVEQL